MENSESLVITWEEPIEPEPPKSKYIYLAEELKARPNEWALIHNGFILFAWWTPLLSNSQYELKKIKIDQQNSFFQLYKVYMRYVPAANLNGDQ